MLAAIATAALAPPAGAEVEQRQGVRVSVDAEMSPARLPRRGVAPIAVSLSAHVTSAGSMEPPQLVRVSLAVNSEARLRPAALPRCGISRLNPATSGRALEACRPALLGEGRFEADVRIPAQTPFPSSGRLLAFNGTYRGGPAILAHVYGTDPFPTSLVIPFRISHRSGTYGTVLNASLPRATGSAGFVTGISLTLNSAASVRRPYRDYLTAGCPAPKGFGGAVFPLARFGLTFSMGARLAPIVHRTCKPA